MTSLFEDPGSLSTCPVLGIPLGMTTEGSGCEDEVDWADRWWNPAHPRLLRWEKGLVWMSSGLVLFSLVVPHFQTGVVGSYPIRSIWFPSHLLLEGTGSYPDFLGLNRWPMVPRVQDPDSSPRTFRRVGSQSYSLDGRQNRYSYVSTGTAAWFGDEAMGLEPPWSWHRIPW
jgi:hypothetical protein